MLVQLIIGTTVVRMTNIGMTGIDTTDVCDSDVGTTHVVMIDCFSPSASVKLN